jgi:protein-tyrosine phosphatase
VPGRTKPSAPAPTAGRDAPRAEEKPASAGANSGTPGASTAGAGAKGSAGSSASPSTGGSVGIAPSTGTVAILAGTVQNARDLGGVALQDGTRVRYGALYRGPPLSDLTASGCAEVAALGLRTVIDLRQPSERQSRPSSACVQNSTRTVLAPLPIPYSLDGRAYIEDLNTFESMAEALRALADPNAYPIYFHCTYGRDRTGVLAAVVLLALGAPRAAILDEYVLSKATVGAYPESLQEMMREVDRQGGIDMYLAKAGMTPAQIAALRLHLADRTLDD